MTSGGVELLLGWCGFEGCAEAALGGQHEHEQQQTEHGRDDGKDQDGYRHRHDDVVVDPEDEGSKVGNDLHQWNDEQMLKAAVGGKQAETEGKEADTETLNQKDRVRVEQRQQTKQRGELRSGSQEEGAKHQVVESINQTQVGK